MASCVKNICTEYYQILIIGCQVTVENVGDVFWNTVYCYYRQHCFVLKQSASCCIRQTFALCLLLVLAVIHGIYDALKLIRVNNNTTKYSYYLGGLMLQ